MKLTVTDLSCRRGETPIIAGVTFSVDAGQSLILRGPNGCGKSTLLRTLVGLAPAPRGTVSADTEYMAYAGHLDGLKGPLTVSENLRFWANIFGTTDIETAIETFDLADFVNRPAHALSAGQKRRLGLARLLVTDRPIWVLDEPTVSLDTANVKAFAQVLANHNAAGGSAIVATHMDLGLTNAATFDLTPYRAKPDQSDNPFLDEALS